jgi:hypothetical protein
MPTPNDHRKDWSSEDIRRYLSGEMPARQRHDLELAALDDPFLSDAIEGLRQLTAGKRSGDMAELEQRLANRVDLKVRPIGKGISTKWWWAAAAVLALLGGSVFWWSERSTKGLEELARVEKDHAAISPKMDTGRIPTSITPTLAPDSSIRSEPLALKDKKEATHTKSVPSLNNPEKERSLEAKADRASEQEIAAARSAPAPAIAAEKAKTIQEPARSDEAVAKAIAAPSAGDIGIFKGRIVDAKGKPVPFANIRLLNGSANYADAQGRFRILFADSLVEITAHSVGYMDLAAKLSARNPENLLTMTGTDATLSEVVVPANGGKSRRQSTKQHSRAVEDDEELEAEPADGWSKYDLYLRNNIRHINLSSAPAVNPEVELSFRVSTTGTPYDFKVERSSCTACEAEAIRLVREGPKWDASTPGKKTLRGFVTLFF